VKECLKKTKEGRREGGWEGRREGGMAYLEFFRLLPHLRKVNFVQDHHLRLGC